MFWKSPRKARQQHQRQQQQWEARKDQPLPAVTPFVYLVVWVAMSAGFLVGFTNGDSTIFIVGFRQLFFPQLHLGMGNPQDRAAGIITAQPFCAFHHKSVQLYMALPCLTTAVGALVSGWLSHRHGRKATIWVGCLFYAVCKVLLMTARATPQAWVAQAVAGLACGMLLQAPMLEVLEVAPVHRRGTLGACIVLGRAAGFLCASMLSVGLALNDSWGWRMVPLFGVWPAVLVMLLLWWLPETPSSLVQRGKLEEGRLALHRLRGFFTNTEAEFRDILAAAELGSQPHTQWQALHVRERALALIMGLGAASLVNAGGGVVLQALAFPVCYATGYGRLKGQIMSMLLMGLGALLGALVAVLAADTVGRRRGTVAGSSVTAACYLAVCCIIKGVYLPGNMQLAAPWAWSLAALMALANAAFVAGPGTLLYIYVFEVQPLPTRALSTAVIIAWLSLQDCAWRLASLPILCAARGWGLFLMFAVLSVINAVLAAAFLLPTKGVPLEQLDTLWRRHWFWRRFCVRPSPDLSALPPELSPGQASLCRMVSLQHQYSSSRHGGSLYRDSAAISSGSSAMPVGALSAAAASAVDGSADAQQGHAADDGSNLSRQLLLDVQMFRRLSAAPAGSSRPAADSSGTVDAAAGDVAPYSQQLQPNISAAVPAEPEAAVASAPGAGPAPH